MAFTGVVGAAVRRPAGRNWLDRGLLPFPVRADGLPRRHAGACPELDCIRHLLPHRIIAAAERRARSIGVGAERVLICADAITEEAYLRALAGSLGRSYERFDGVTRADCPLDDDQLIDAAAAGLLPLRHGNGIVWIIVPRGLIARRLADPRVSWPRPLQAFRLTSDDRLRYFVALHSHRAGQAGDRQPPPDPAAVLECTAALSRASNQGRHDRAAGVSAVERRPDRHD